jgi:hypothetical protein
MVKLSNPPRLSLHFTFPIGGEIVTVGNEPIPLTE